MESGMKQVPVSHARACGAMSQFRAQGSASVVGGTANSIRGCRDIFLSQGPTACDLKGPNKIGGFENQVTVRQEPLWLLRCGTKPRRRIGG
jgi:hypothetical protein